jgi:hypothetical protein
VNDEPSRPLLEQVESASGSGGWIRSHLIRRDDLEREAFDRLPLVFGRLLGASAEDDHCSRPGRRELRRVET